MSNRSYLLFRLVLNHSTQCLQSLTHSPSAGADHSEVTAAISLLQRVQRLLFARLLSADQNPGKISRNSCETTTIRILQFACRVILAVGLYLTLISIYYSTCRSYETTRALHRASVQPCCRYPASGS